MPNPTILSKNDNNAFSSAIAVNDDGDFSVVFDKYASGLNRFHFFRRGFIYSMRFSHSDRDYQTPVDSKYFNDIVWQNVGNYLYKGMKDLEHDEPQTQGTQKQNPISTAA